MAKIRVIDLLNKIANGEEIPEKIKHNGTEYNLNEITGWYQSIDVIGNVNKWFISKYRLNDTVEIIEEQQDIDIQELEEFEIKGGNGEIEYFEYDNHGATESGYSKNYSLDDIECRKVINKLVQAVKQLDRNIKDKE